MSKKNLRRSCVVMLSALFSSAFMTSANEDNVVYPNENNEENRGVIVQTPAPNGVQDVDKYVGDLSSLSTSSSDDSNTSENVNNWKNKSLTSGMNVKSNLEQTNKSSSWSKPLKLTLVGGGLLGILAATKYGKDYYDHKSALEEAKKYANDNQKNQGNPLEAWISHIEDSNLPLSLKAKLLTLFKNDGCSILANWLSNRLENVSFIDKHIKFGFLTESGFIKACQDFKDNSSGSMKIRLVLRFVGSYLQFNKESLLANPPTSFEQIPNWDMIKTIINSELIPQGAPEKIENAMVFKFQDQAKRVYSVKIR